MPCEETWNSFFKPKQVLKKFGVKSGNIADIGAGYGTFSIPAAEITKGKVFAIEINKKNIQYLKAKTKEKKLKNLKALQTDVSKGTGLKKNSLQHVLLFNILHCENPVRLLKEAERILEPKGQVSVMHWNYDKKTPRGPSMSIRPKLKQVINWAKKAGLEAKKIIDLKPFHYGITFKKSKNF